MTNVDRCYLFQIESISVRSFASLRMTNVDRADKLAGAIMLSNTWIGVAELSPRADESAMGTINRPLRVSGLFVNWFIHPHSFETQKASQCNNDQRLQSHRIHYFLSHQTFARELAAPQY